VIIFFPALSPVYAWYFSETELFSLVAQHLQYDTELVEKTLYLYSIAAMAYVGVAMPSVIKNKPYIRTYKVGVLEPYFVLIACLLTIGSAYTLEAGPTIISANYTSIFEGRMVPSTFTAFVGATFGGIWAILFIFGRHQKKMFWISTIVAVIWLFLHVRRVEVFGVVILLVLWGKYRISKRKLFLLFGSFILVQAAIGTIRDSALLDYFGSDAHQRVIQQKKAALPGGASIVFLSGLHLVNVRDAALVGETDRHTMAEWPRSIIPNTIWEIFGIEAVQTEHEIIYEKLGLSYVGGMPLLGAFYLNGGVFMVLIYGLLHAFLGRKIDNVLDTQLRPHFYRGGTLRLLIASVFVIYQFRYQWYIPQTLFRAVAFTLVLYLFISPFIFWKRGVAVKLNLGYRRAKYDSKKAGSSYNRLLQ
jgi:hypothetical protein